MLNHTLTAAIIALGIGLVAPTAARAQFAPMDMSWGMQSQMRLSAIGQETAQTTGMNYYMLMQQLRANNYRGPSLPTGVTAESLIASNNAANQATAGYIGSQLRNSQRRSFATGDYVMRAIRGCTAVYPYGYVCP